MIRTISQKLLSLAALAGAMVFSTLSLGSTDYVGTATCAGCHEQPFADWQGSHHDLAMQAVTEKSVLGNFNDARLPMRAQPPPFIARMMLFGYAPTTQPESSRTFALLGSLASFPCNSICCQSVTANCRP